MSAPALDASLLDFASTLDPAKAPEKMRCPKCSRFLINGYKVSCCDTTMCETCYQAASNKCPECGHSPFNDSTVKASSAARKTMKSWLKEQKAKAEKPPTPSIIETPAEATPQPLVDAPQEANQIGGDAEAAEQPTSATAMSLPVEEQAVSSIEEPEDGIEQHSDPVDGNDANDANDDDIEIQVEPDHDDPHYIGPQDEDTQEQASENPSKALSKNDEDSRPHSREEHDSPTKPGYEMNGMDSQNMDFNNPMMQQMQQMMANGFNPMMNMQMGMNPMGNMFGGFGPNGGMNGMNMMNFNPQNMFGAFQNSNMWQNSNANAFSNGMGGDFTYGFNSNFNNQQYPNGDFHQSGYRGRGYGRGRGRGRGGYGRGRGNFYNNYDNNNTNNSFQSGYDQQWQNQPPPHTNGQAQRQEEPKLEQLKQEEPLPDDDEFAPGGQEEVQEALGDDYAKKETKPEEPTPVDTPTDPLDKEPQLTVDAEPMETEDTQARVTTDAPVQEIRPIAEAYSEDLDMVMAPPSAPAGPAGRHGDKDFGFRSRGHGKYPRSRGSIHLSNGRPPSPVRSPSGPPVSRSDSAAPGVAGAPTGPRAMREPPAKPSRPTSGGFQIMGRASLASRTTERRSPSPVENNNEDREDRSSRRYSRREDEEEYRKHRKSRREENGDYEMKDEEDSYSRHESQDRARKSRRDKDKYGSRSSKYDSRRGDDEYDVNDYGEATDEPDRSSRRDRKHRDRDRERDRDRDRDKERERDRGERDRDRERDRERDRDRDRDRGERDREREDRHRDKERDRKRRRDRDEDDYDDEYDSPRHKSRRHRKEHSSATTREDDAVNGRSSHRSSQVPTPTATPIKEESEMDPNTRERMERDRQRMLKEQQRRENAAAALKGGSSRSSGGPRRQMSFKYEDEAERGMIEGERERNRGRWR